MKNLTHCLLATIALAVSLRGQTVAWTQLSAGAAPGPRWDHALVENTSPGTLLLFGGRSGPSSFLGDTWIWDGTGWSQPGLSASPPPRFGHGMAFDSVRGRVVVFGGHSGTAIYGDTWEWDGSTWTQMNPGGGPTPRYFLALAYSPALGRTVLFGGRGANGLLSDTWEWNGTGWIPKVVAQWPVAREDHRMAFDPLSQRVLMFGGNDGNGALADLWRYDGLNWSQIAYTGGPGGRVKHALAYDRWRGAMVLFGGIGASPSGTWEWSGGAWTELQVANPADRFGHALCFDPGRRSIVLFGGKDLPAGSTVFADQWELAGPRATAEGFGTGCGSPALAIAPVTGSLPLIGQTYSTVLSNVPQSGAFMALGFSDQFAGPFPLPLSLAGFGLPGCELYQSAELLISPTVSVGPGAAQHNLAIPNASVLLQVNLFLQAWSIVQGQNPGGHILSNAIHLVIGSR